MLKFTLSIVIALIVNSHLWAQVPELEQVFASWNAQVTFNAELGGYFVVYPTAQGGQRLVFISVRPVQQIGLPGINCVVLEPLPPGVNALHVQQVVAQRANLQSQVIGLAPGSNESVLAIPVFMVPQPGTDWRITFDQFGMAARTVLGLNAPAAPPVAAQPWGSPPTEVTASRPVFGSVQEEIDDLQAEREACLKEIEIHERSAADFDRQFQHSVRDPYGVPSGLSASFSMSASAEKRAALTRLARIDRRLAELQRHR
jgi:hypothetical protein